MFTLENKKEIKDRINEVINYHEMTASIFIVRKTVRVTLTSGPLFKNLDGRFLTVSHPMLCNDIDGDDLEFLIKLYNEMARGRWIFSNIPETKKPHSWKCQIKFGRWDRPYKYVETSYMIIKDF